MVFKNSLIIGVVVFYLFATSLFSYDPAARFDKNEKPKELEGVGVQEKLGNGLDLSLSFRDETGKLVLLSSFLKKINLFFYLLFITNVRHCATFISTELPMRSKN
ncbi:hypothetical protein LEP1GSC043_0809 [Leptospira weilii str. Ecochallenge]|uniref:Uncharacterized protein n=1 Tax=Leptospira weilii str. Ecochallenge TaxID=1049986 RepID=N1UBR0_9LEPT|nr:hypothetical protein LEP1GSC043_0809 [Leptospira weilii str. Ecochallenge]